MARIVLCWLTLALCWPATAGERLIVDLPWSSEVQAAAAALGVLLLALLCGCTWLLVRFYNERARRAYGSQLASMADNFPGALFRRRIWRDGQISYDFISEGAPSMFGAPTGDWRGANSIDELVGRALPVDRGRFREALERSAREVSPLDVEVRVAMPDGGFRWIRTVAKGWAGADGAAVFDGVAFDVTDRRLAEDAVRQAERRLAEISANLPGIIYRRILYPDGRFRYLDVRGDVEGIFFVPRTDFLAMTTLEQQVTRLAPEDRAEWVAAVRRSAETLAPFDLESRVRAPDGTVRWVRSMARPSRLPDGSVVWDGVSLDVTDRKRAEERQQLLLAELDHRVKNTLATVQSIAARTLSGSEEAQLFAGRLAALASTHTLIAEGGWQGARLAEIVAAELAPYGTERAQVGGDDVVLTPRAAQTIGLALHELATNAAKHGALSAPGGRVEVAWSLDRNGAHRKLAIQWRERGGPHPEPPRRRGFGLEMIERSIGYELTGHVKVAFEPEGFACDIEVDDESPAGRHVLAQPSCEFRKAHPHDA